MPNGSSGVELRLSRPSLPCWVEDPPSLLLLWDPESSLVPDGAPEEVWSVPVLASTPLGRPLPDEPLPDDPPLDEPLPVGLEDPDEPEEFEPPDDPLSPEEPEEPPDSGEWDDPELPDEPEELEEFDDPESPPFPLSLPPLSWLLPPSPWLLPCPAALSRWCRAAPPAREPSPSRSDSPNVCFQFSAEDLPSSQPFFTVRPTS
ncbi:hypothetical protein AB0442_10960, partial [Kitasatospora sp. NPDC085895]